MFKYNFLIPVLSSVYLLLILATCTPNLEAHINTSFESISASSIISINDHFVVTGSAKELEKTDIKAPFVMVFDSTLKKIKQFHYQTSSTSLDPKIISVATSEYILSFYGAKSLVDQTEISHLLYLNSNFNTIKTLSYGNRTRMSDLGTQQNGTVISLNYERSTQENSIQFVKNKTIKDQMIFAVSDETNIPSALLITNQDEILIAGIANGFHYPDGHEYKEANTYGYIIQTDPNGLETNRYTHHGEGHVYIHALSHYEKTIHAIGTYQSAETSMDILHLTLDEELNLLSESIHKESGVQEGLTLATTDSHLYVAGINEDTIDYTMNLKLYCLDKNQQLIWEKTFIKPGSQKPLDILINKNRLIILSQSLASRTAAPESSISSFTLEGDLLQETKIH